MGTRSLTLVYDEVLDGKYDNTKEVQKTKLTPILNMYRQFDGYPHGGHGQELAEFLKPIKIVNGISGDRTKIANGMCCLAAQIVAHFKKEAGGIYIYPTDARDCWQDYEYHVYDDRVEIFAGREIDGTYEKPLFSGTWKEFANYCSKEQKEEE